MNRNRKLIVTFVLTLIVVQLVAGCGATATPTSAPTVAPTKSPPTAVPPTTAPTSVPPTATAIPATATPQGPKVGGTLIYALPGEPDTFDPHRTAVAYAIWPLRYVGANLLAYDPNGKIVPYLAEGYTVAPDGLSYEFKLKKGIKFHDGTALTAQDIEFTLNRTLDPDIKTTTAKSMLGPVDTITALDDLTLQIKLKTPYFSLLLAMTDPTYLQPMSKAYVTKVGEGIRTAPMSVGPYKFKEYTVGKRVVLERNPDFNWGPAYAHAGPWYIQTIEYRILPEYSTLAAGVEAGELDVAGIQNKDVARIEALGTYQVLEGYAAGLNPWGLLNNSKPPFDDIRVRQAFNYALDRQSMVKVVVMGDGLGQQGPMSRSVMGYWPGVEAIGYKFDLAKAKELMKEAGYTPGADGILQKNGQPLQLTLYAMPQEPYSKVAEVWQDQLKALGVGTKIQTTDTGVLIPMLLKGDYELGILGISTGEVSTLWNMLHSSQAGAGYNLCQVKDPETDEMVDAMLSASNPDTRQQLANDIQKRVVEQAYMVPMYTPKVYTFVSNRVKGVVWSALGNSLYLNDAWIQD